MSERLIATGFFRKYLTAHWRGQQPLWYSFWINLVALRLLIFSAQNGLATLVAQDVENWRVFFVVLAAISHVLILCWQIVGVVRAADQHFAHHGNMALVWGAQLGATLLFILSAVYLLGAVQFGLSSPSDDRPGDDIAKNRVPAYAVEVTGSELSIKGDIQPGITRAIERQLSANPSIVLIRLHSMGGNIFEARGLSRLFARTGMATHVEDRCASACTTAYIGGIVRSATANASFGFHQYRMSTAQLLVVTSAEKEQRIDMDLFLEAGVNAGFVHAMFDTTPGDMWWPSMESLLNSGVVHELR